MRTEGFKGALLSTLVIVSLITPLLLLSPSPVYAALTPHAPIYIDGNDNFTPANGVTSGSGTVNNPYIIENWDISAENANGIEIKNTDAYFVIRNCYVHDGDNFNNGIHFDNVINGRIDNVTSDNNRDGISFWGHSSNNIIENCTVENNSRFGINLWHCPNNKLRNNTLSNNTYNFHVWGYTISLFYQDVDTSNKVNGKPIYYVIGQENLTFDGNVMDVGYLGLVSCENIQVKNLTLSNNGNGLLLAYTSFSTITNCIIKNNHWGIEPRFSNCIIKNCTIENTRSYGINLFYSSNNNIITNCTIKNNDTGIHLRDSSENNLITNCTAENNGNGITLENSDNNALTNNTCSNNSNDGIYLWSSSDNNVIENCTAESNDDTGIRLGSSDNNIIRNCTLKNNTWPGIGFWDSSNNTIENCTAENNRDGIIFWGYSDNNIVENCVAINNIHQGIKLENSDNNTVTNCTTENNNNGIHLESSDNNVIKNCTASNNNQGIMLNHSHGNLVSGCIVENNEHGIYLEGGSDNNIVKNCTAKNNVWSIALRHSSDSNIIENCTTDGISLCHSSNNNVVKNCIIENSGGVGVSLDNSDNNRIENCTVWNNYGGIALHSSSNNTISNNIVVNNGPWSGIWLGSSDNNLIYHNNFIINTNQANDNGSNYWDNGYPSGGNYWGDYTGGDNYQGENQDQPGSDGIGDTPYVIPGDNNRDRYPLMNPVGVFKWVLVSISETEPTPTPKVDNDYRPTLATAEPGENIVTVVKVANISTLEDNYTISVVDDLGWQIEFSPDNLTIPACGEGNVVVKITVDPAVENKVQNLVKITATGTGVQDTAVLSTAPCFPMEEPPYTLLPDNHPLVHKNPYFYQFSTPSLLVELPAQPIIIGTETAYTLDETPREPYPIPFGMREFPVMAAADEVENGRVIIYGPGAGFRSGPSDHFSIENLRMKELGPRMIGWLVGWENTAQHKVLFYWTTGAFHNAERLSEWIDYLRAQGYTVHTFSDGITPERLAPYSVLMFIGPERDFTSAERAAIRDWVRAGGGLFISDQADYQGYGMAACNNSILEALGVNIRQQDDQATDNVEYNRWPWEPRVYLADHEVWYPPFWVSISVSPFAQSGENGQTLTYDVVIMNEGTNEDNYSVEVSDTENWNPTLSENLLTIPAWENMTVTLTVGIPVDVAPGTLDDVTVTVTGTGVRASETCRAYVPYPPPPWDALITATFPQGSDDAIFGVRHDATAGFDSAYDLPEPPAPVEPPYVQTYFYYPGNDPQPTRLHRSCIPPENLMEWPLRISYRDSVDNITISWSIENIPADFSVLLFRGENLVADMRTIENYTFKAVSGDHDFRVIVGGVMPFTLKLVKGWNMISLPVVPENLDPDAIFGEDYYVLYRWDAENKRYVLHADSGSFIEPDPDVEAGVGYWAYVLENENVNLLGFPVNQLNLSLRQGWNLIGPPYGGSNIADPIDNPDNSVLPWAFTWNAEERSYSMTQQLEAGKGYWVYTLRYCSLILPPKEPRKCVLAIEHFSIIAGTTWSGAHDRAGKRLDDLYPWLEYVYEEEVGPEEAIPTARDLIATKGANIVVGNAEFMGLPLKDLADEYPDVYFGATIASDITAKRNFIRFFPRQYQALYLEGLVMGAITRTNKIGIVSPFPCIQVCRRQNSLYLGIKDANPDATVYVKYAGDWYNPPVEAEIAATLIDEYGCDVLTNQTDSSAPVEVAEDRGIWFIGKDMDIVGELGWSTVETVAVSYDTRWEVIYDKIIKEYMVGNEHPENLMFVGMEDRMFLENGEEVPVVDLQNDNKVGIEAISPHARPLISDNIIELIENKRNLLLEGNWDPFLYELRSNGTGLDLPGLPVPPKGTLVKPEGEMPTDEWLLSKFNFDLENIVVLE